MDLDALQKCMDDGRKAAAKKPGRYGGRYLARRYDRKARAEVFIVLADDDPDMKECRDEALDIFAQAMPGRVHGMGGARNWFTDDGRQVDRAYFSS